MWWILEVFLRAYSSFLVYGNGHSPATRNYVVGRFCLIPSKQHVLLRSKESLLLQHMSYEHWYPYGWMLLLTIEHIRIWN